MKRTIDGLGTSVPPLKEHVIIYFLQKDIPEKEAITFYDHFQKKKWKNQRNKSLFNWKIAAWEWILKITFFSHETEAI